MQYQSELIASKEIVYTFMLIVGLTEQNWTT